MSADAVTYPIANFRGFIIGFTKKADNKNIHFTKFLGALKHVLQNFKFGLTFMYERKDSDKTNIIEYCLTKDEDLIEIYYDRLFLNSHRVATKLSDFIHIFHHASVTFSDFNLLESVEVLTEKQLTEVLEKLFMTLLPN